MKVLMTILTLLVLISCIEPFETSFTDSQSTIVIDGIITDELKRHEVVIRYTSPIDSFSILPLEKASVRIIINGNLSLLLTEEGPGVYKTEPFQGKIDDSFKLSVSIEDGEVFESSTVTLRPTPNINSVYGRFTTLAPLNERGFEVLVDASDPSNTTQYLRWEWEETYEINSPYPTRFQWIGGNNLRELNLDSSRFCWNTIRSSTVHIASTSEFTQAEISQFPLRFIREFEDPIQANYSIEVKQYALSVEGYEYWKTLKDIGERQGSIFDLQPGLIEGNIKAIDSDVIVLGYFDAAQVASERIFVSPVEFTELGLLLNQQFVSDCTDKIEILPARRIGSYMASFGDERNIIGALSDSVYITGPKICTDCTLRGTNTRPDFWL